METFRTIVLLFVAVIHVIPSIGVMSAAQLRQLYGVSPSDPTLLLLMRHRAVLFGILGTGFMGAALAPELHGPGLLAAGMALGSFLALARSARTENGPEIRRLVSVDGVAFAAVAAAGATLLV